MHTKCKDTIFEIAVEKDLQMNVNLHMNLKDWNKKSRRGYAN